MKSSSMIRQHVLSLSLAAALLGISSASASVSEPGDAWLDKLDRGLRQNWSEDSAPAGSKQEPVDVLIVMHDASGEAKRVQPGLADPVARRDSLAKYLKQTAEQSQRPLRDWLSAQGIKSQAFWVANAVAASVPKALLPQLAARQDVAQVISNAPYRQQPVPSQEKQAAAPIGIPWGVQKIGAPNAWALGYRGQGAVVGGQDTGYQWDHPALKDKYRGWNGASADHDYNWHDAIHELIKADGPNSCGLDVTAPCDDSQHGTHTMGTMVGDDGVGNQPGVAPDAKWIGCRNMEEGWGTHSTYIECFEWFIEPTDIAGNNPDPS